jgi:phage portal protein BeeE
MAKLWRSLLGRDDVTRYSQEQYLADLSGNRSDLIVGYGPSPWTRTEDIENSFIAYVQALYKSSGVVYAVMGARRLLFRQARVMWQEFADGIEGKLFWTDELEIFRKPWPNGTTGELLARMDQDVSLGGNFYAVREQGPLGDRIRRLRPDWVTIVLTAPPAEAVASDVAGYWFHPGRSYTQVMEPEPRDAMYLPGEVCHWTPDPDPEAQYRGMSWLTPVVREVQSDKAATLHKQRFFDNGATLGAVIAAKENLTTDQFKEWMDNLQKAHAGVNNAYKPLYLGSPVDVSVLTADMRQLDFKATQGAGETRICAAGRVPPIIVGVSEGLQAATYSNYGQARRAFGDAWAHPQWEDAIGALETLVEGPARRWYPKARLWYASKHIAFLREDQKDAAEIQQIKASTINSLINAGWKPITSRDAVETENFSLLEHTGLVSVQLQPPGAPRPPGGAPAALPAPPAQPAADQPSPNGHQAARALGHDVTPGHDELHHYWTRGEGLAKWAGSPTPWTTLEHHLEKFVGPERAKRMAAEWFHEVFGFWPGSDKNRVAHGKPPRGHRVGPG